MKKAPWAMVPFCDSRKETEGYRFWKTGYWKTVLESNPYHISALFVVDLSAFRRLALGERLRRNYHSLSADPNSLANLDQDLPNHMQDEYPIHALPSEWLWCETWCDDESKDKAKSIDLCNWPGRKESKIEQGKRLIPEWSEYDHEIGFIINNTKAIQKSEL
jgi:UDP-glucose:glycoprotein glucosyltransferase